MNIDFNNLRVKLALHLDSLTQTLNRGVLPSTENVLVEGEDGSENWIAGDVLVSSFKLKSDLETLRQLTILLACCSEPGDEDFVDVSDTVEDNGGIACFLTDNI